MTGRVLLLAPRFMVFSVFQHVQRSSTRLIAQIKRNDLGTRALVVTQIEANKSNMSCRGEMSMYLLSAAGDFYCYVTLNKEGPICDVTWSPNGKEFGAVHECESTSQLIDIIGSGPFLIDVSARTMSLTNASAHS